MSDKVNPNEKFANPQGKPAGQGDQKSQSAPSATQKDNTLDNDKKMKTGEITDKKVSPSVTASSEKRM